MINKILFFLIFLFSSSFSKANAEISFLAMADGPYSENYYNSLPKEFKTIPKEAQFAIHLGDIFPTEAPCHEKDYQRVDNLFRTFPKPIFFVVGGNEANECPDPSKGWPLWKKYFGTYERHWQSSFLVKRQWARKENFSFSIDNIIFIGIHLINSPIRDEKEWEVRQIDNLEWIAENLLETDKNYRAAVIFSHIFPGLGTHDQDYISCKFYPGETFDYQESYFPFTHGFIKFANTFNKPILFLHGSEHCSHFDHPLKKAPNVTRIIQGSLGKYPISKITITDNLSQEIFLFDKRYKERAQLFQKEASKGNAFSQYKMSQIYLNKLKDYQKGIYHLEKGTEENFIPSIVELAKIYYSGKVSPLNYSMAFKLFLKAIHLKENDSATESDLELSNNQVLKEAQLQIETSYLDALFYIGVMNGSGWGTPKNPEKALKYFKKAAKIGHGKSSYNLGLIYKNGVENIRDYKEALKQFIEADRRGISKSKFNIALMYMKGTGVPKNNKKAFEWFEKAAHVNDTDAQYNLAYFYLTGLAGPKDINKSIYWLKIAASLGHVKSQQSLITMMGQRNSKP
jgi:TPR repeat protein